MKQCTSHRMDNDRNLPACITRTIGLGIDDFVYIQTILNQMSSGDTTPSYRVSYQQDSIVLSTSRQEYQVEICITADDNLTGRPEITAQVCSSSPLFSIWGDAALSHELTKLAEELLTFSHLIFQAQLREWGVKTLAPAGHGSGGLGGNRKQKEGEEYGKD